MLARLVVLPEPVGPVTRSRPRGRMISRLMASGMPICSNVRNWLGMRRSTMPMLPRCLKTATRKRKPSVNSMAKSAPPFSCSSCWQRSGVMLFIRAVVSSLSSDLGVELAHAAVVADHRRLADGDVQVAGLELDDRGQQLVDQDVAVQPRHLPRQCDGRRTHDGRPTHAEMTVPDDGRRSLIRIISGIRRRSIVATSIMQIAKLGHMPRSSRRRSRRVIDESRSSAHRSMSRRRRRSAPCER